MCYSRNSWLSLAASKRFRLLWVHYEVSENAAPGNLAFYKLLLMYFMETLAEGGGGKNL